ncbi:hypothetical protein [Microcystis aeruginosa]|jgi:hypothetical protein|uniref:hypothetical protein n=1 Tax=Microcystis aeruginosa TaxID=1126 RepID=UPI000ACEE908|nr:hypothetical protein [Microcystis aeruginosa]
MKTSKFTACLVFVATAMNLSFYSNEVLAQNKGLSERQCEQLHRQIAQYFEANAPSPLDFSQYNNWINSLASTIAEAERKYPECKVTRRVSDSDRQQLQQEYDAKRERLQKERMCYAGYANVCREIGDEANYRSARRRVCNQANLKYDARSDSCY